MWRDAREGKNGEETVSLGGSADKSWAMESDLKRVGDRAEDLVLKKVSKNLPLLSSSKPAICPVLSLPASSSAPDSPQDCHCSRAGELRQQGEGQAKEGVT